MKRVIPLLLTLALLPVVVACSDDEVDSRYTDYRYDIVTYLGTDGTTARFAMTPREGRPTITLTADIAIDPRYKAGQRMWLRYMPETGLTDTLCRVTAYAATAVTTDSLRYSVRPIGHYTSQMQPVDPLSLWQTGDYVNLHFKVEYTPNSRHFYLLLDSASRHADTVRTYLVNNTFNDTLYHWREAYASFYIGSVLRQPTCRVLDIALTNRDNQLRHFYFKQQ